MNFRANVITFLGGITYVVLPCYLTGTGIFA